MLLIPFTSQPANTFTVQLGDFGKFEFSTQYNDQAGFWTFDLTRSIDGVRLATAIPLLLGQDLLAPYGLAMGGLIPIDESNQDVEAGTDDLGDRVNVYWFSPDEIAALPRSTASATTIPTAATSFTPDQLGSTLRLWLRADGGYTLDGSNNVTYWRDRSGGGNHVIQNSAGNRPAFNASAINGLPGITFGSGKYLINTVNNIVGAGAARTVFAVAQSTSAANLQVVVAFHQPDLTFTQYNFNLGLPGVTGGRAYIYSDFVVQSQRLAANPTIINAPGIYEYGFSGVLGTQVTFKLNGTPYASDSGTVANAETTASGFVVGADLYVTDYLIGDLCELIVCDSVIADATAAKVRGYFAARYGIAA